MKTFASLAALIPLALVAVSGCAHIPAREAKDPQFLLQRACDPGHDVKSVQGSVWMKAKSKDSSGQFPANVQADDTGRLRLEVTDLIGGTQALITIEGQRYEVETPGQKKKIYERGEGSWGGIPLRWADDLFLGRIPCPDASQLTSATLSVNPEGALVVKTAAGVSGDAEEFTYRFRAWAGTLWPESLEWKREGPFGTTVDFSFDDPEDGTHSPKKWEAHSPQGEVKVRWKNREMAR